MPSFVTVFLSPDVASSYQQMGFFLAVLLKNMKRVSPGTKQPWGKHYLNDMLKNFIRPEWMVISQITAYSIWNYRNLSKEIKDFTGHRSIKGVHQYGTVAVKQKQAACNILTGAT